MNINVQSLRESNICMLSRPEVKALASSGRIVDASFVADDIDGENGMVLVVEFKDGDQVKIGALFKQDHNPRVFTTAETIMSNAKKLGIDRYRIDAQRWSADYYKANEASNRWHAKRRQVARCGTSAEN